MRTLLVASTGGHLEQISRLRQRFVPASTDVAWVTFDDPQARSLLAEEDVRFVPYIPPRGYAHVIRAVPAAFQLLRRGSYDRVVSTGAGVALAFLPMARLFGIEAHYVESSARAEGPSLTGRLVARVPGVRLYSQYRSWADGRWAYQGSLFDDYTPGRVRGTDGQARRVVVTLGTMRNFGFRRAVDRLVQVLPEVAAPDAEILWQVGATDVADLPIEAHVAVPAAELRGAIERADLVIAHAGIGSCLTALDAGRCPVLLPRRPELGEHIDAHQQMIADELDSRGLAIGRSPDTLTAADLRAAMRRSVDVAASGPFGLQG
jgi:UDP-N-acetylglucosamine transferase subunit ALG13